MSIERFTGSHKRNRFVLSDEIKRKIVDDVSASVSVALPARIMLSPTEADKVEIRNLVKQTLRRVEQSMGIWGRIRPAEEEELLQNIMYKLLGLGFLEQLLPPNRDDVSEITVNPDGTVWIMTKGSHGFTQTDIRVTEREVKIVIDRMLGPQNRMITEAEPIALAKLPRTERLPGGARVTVVGPPIANGDIGYSINIRLFQPKPVRPEQLLAWNELSEEMLEFLRQAIRRRRRIMIAGPTASGKTTFLSALAEMIYPPTERIVLIEDPAEIFLDLPHVVSLEARPPNVEGKYGVELGHLVTLAMRMSPSWLILGEVRTGKAGVWLLRAQMSAHAGLSTIHADSPDTAIKTLGLLAQLEPGLYTTMEAIKMLVSRAVHYFVQLTFDPWGARRVGLITRVVGIKDGDVEMEDVFVYSHEKSKEGEPVWEYGRRPDGSPVSLEP